MQTFGTTMARAAVVAMGVAGGVVAAASSAAAVGCSPAGTTGMNAAVVVTTRTSVTGTVDATGCDIGIYLGPGASGSVVHDATVSNAHDHGILVQDVGNVVVRDSTITHNGLALHSDGTKPLSEDKAVTLLGTHAVRVEHNVVMGNMGDGGISLNDDGPGQNEAVLTHGLTRASTANVVRDNVVAANHNGCGIVLSAFVVGAGVNDNLVVGNTVSGAPWQFVGGPVTGSIVVAADLPFTQALRNVVLANTVTDSFIPGIIVHSNAPGDLVAGTKILGNTVARADWFKVDGPPAMVGIALASESAGAPTPSVLTGTVVAGNSISGEDIGIWSPNAVKTHLGGNTFTDVTTPVAIG